jgi:hypothetical protein
VAEPVARHARGRSRKRSTVLWVGVLLIGSLVTAGGTIAWVVSQGPPARVAALDLSGHPVQVDPGTVAPTTAAAAKVQQDTGQRFVVPAVGLNVALDSLGVANGNITPPGFTSAYLVRNLGTTLTRAATGTVYVVMHSIRGGGVGPGNYLQNSKTGSTSLHTGDIITVGGVDYRMASSTLVLKTQLPADSNVWANIPRRLIVITCLEKTDGSPSTNNLIITATGL